MGTIKIILGVCLIVFLISLISASPPPLPVLVYGKVVDKDNNAVPGKTVEITWTDISGKTQTTKTSTLTSLGAELLGSPELMGYYRFEINALENSMITLRSGDASFEFKAVSGKPIEIPNLAIGTKSILNDGDNNVFENLFDFIGNIFNPEKTNESTGSEQDYDSEDDYEGEGHEEGELDQGGDTGEDSEESLTDYQDIDDSENTMRDTESNQEIDAPEYDSDSMDDTGPYEPGETTLKEDTNIEYESYDKTIKKSEIVRPKSSSFYKTSISQIKIIFTSSAQFLQNYTTSKDFIADIIIFSIIIGVLIIFFSIKIFKKFHKIKPEESLKYSIKKIDRLSSKIVMDKDLKTLNSEDSLLDAIQLFTTYNLNIIPIISSSGRTLGIITKKILLSKITKFNLDFLETTKIKTIMQKKFIKCAPDIKLKELYDLMLKKNSGEIIIEDRDTLIGTVDYFNILNILDNVNFKIENPPALGDNFSKKTVFISHKNSLLKLRDIFIKKNTNYAIVKKDSEPLGIITTKDLINALKKELDLKKNNVQNIMSTNMLVISPGTTVYEAVRIMLDRKFNQIPVVMKDKVIGIIDIKSLLRFYYDFISELKSSKRDISIEKEDWSRRIET